MVYIYLPSPCYIDGNSFRFFFFKSPLSSPLFSYHARGPSHFSHHCFYCWVKEDVSEKWNVSAIFSPVFDPSSCTQNLSMEARLLIWVYYLTFLTRYWVSATRISCCDRLTLRALAHQTLIQQRTPCQVVIYPKQPDSRAHFRSLGDYCQRRTFWYLICNNVKNYFTITVVISIGGKGLSAEGLDAPVKERLPWTACCPALQILFMSQYLFTGKYFVVQWGLLFSRGFMWKDQQVLGVCINQYPCQMSPNTRTKESEKWNKMDCHRHHCSHVTIISL